MNTDLKPNVPVNNTASLHTGITISNSDVITMLIVKNRKHLEDKKFDLFKKIHDMNTEMSIHLLNQVKKIYEKPKYQAIKKAQELLITSIVKCKIAFQESSYTSSAPYFYNNGGYLPEDGIFEIKTLRFYFLNEKDQDEEQFCNDISDYITDIQINCNHKIKLNVDTIQKYKVLNLEYSRIQSKLANEAKMKDELIAKVTENALKSSPELQAQLGIDESAYLLLD